MQNLGGKAKTLACHSKYENRLKYLFDALKQRYNTSSAQKIEDLKHELKFFLMKLNKQILSINTRLSSLEEKLCHQGHEVTDKKKQKYFVAALINEEWDTNVTTEKAAIKAS